MSQNTVIIITTSLENNYWQAHSAVDFILIVLPEDGPAGPKHIATF
jgi:hypothetical protein